MLDAFRKVLAFVSGIVLVISGLLNERPRAATIVIGLSLMGTFTIPEAFGMVKGKSKED
jgi:hypothetical protein